jgi:hypothetical protein
MFTSSWLPAVRATSVAMAASAAALVAAPAQAAQFSGRLEFIEPAGVVGPTDSIPVWIRLTLDADSPDPLVITTDSGDTPPFGIPPDYYPTEFFLDEGNGDVPASSFALESVFINTSFTCSGTFTSSCIEGPPYLFDFNTDPPDSINFLPTPGTTFSLQPGESLDYLFGTFVPSDGPVAPGSYFFYGSSLSLNFFGQSEEIRPVLDDEGNPIQLVDDNGAPVFDDEGNPVFETQTEFVFARGEYDFASTPCSFGSGPDCVGAFSRTVVPVPGAVWLLGSAVGLLAWRRRQA